MMEKKKIICQCCRKEVFKNIRKETNEDYYKLCPNCIRKKTTLKKYGVENISCIKEIQEKKKQTSIKNYGVDSPNKIKSVQNKKKISYQEKYGVENPFQSEKFFYCKIIV